MTMTTKWLGGSLLSWAVVVSYLALVLVVTTFLGVAFVADSLGAQHWISGGITAVLAWPVGRLTNWLDR